MVINHPLSDAQQHTAAAVWQKITKKRNGKWVNELVTNGENFVVIPPASAVHLRYFLSIKCYIGQGVKPLPKM